MAYVFQYGSNCLDSEINGPKRLMGDAKFISIAHTVDNYNLVFDVFSTKRNCAAADIIEGGDTAVTGALYEVPDFLLDRKSSKDKNRVSFDEIEGAGKNYQRRIINVLTPSGKIIQAYTYTVISPKIGLKTSIEYVTKIVLGLRSRGVDENYILIVKESGAKNNPDIEKELNGL